MQKTGLPKNINSGVMWSHEITLKYIMPIGRIHVENAVAKKYCLRSHVEPRNCIKVYYAYQSNPCRKRGGQKILTPESCGATKFPANIIYISSGVKRIYRCHYQRPLAKHVIYIRRVLSTLKHSIVWDLSSYD